MGNHVHLLLKTAASSCIINVNGTDLEAGPGGPGETLDQVVKRIGVSYVMYFNRKYKRVGSLFQDRYRSEAIETESYLLAALRYIHQNPVKAGICTKACEYRQSSYREYLDQSSGKIADTDLILGIVTKEWLKEQTEQTEETDNFIDVEDDRKSLLTDIEAKEKMYQICACKSVSEFQMQPKAERDKHIRSMYSAGIYIAQIGRITGYSRQVLYRALKS